MTLFKSGFSLTVDYLQKLFDSCNTIYFAKPLIKIPISIINDDTNNGYFKFDIDIENRLLKNPRIEISNMHACSYEGLEKTMIHEMLHYRVFLELDSDRISDAFDALVKNDTDAFDRLLSVGKYAHDGKWTRYADDINNMYKFKIRHD